MNLTPTIVTIDGPAASGKSTIAHQVAERLHYLFFDTGVMYRAVTQAALERGIDVKDEDAVTALAEQLAIDILPPSPEDDDGRQCTVHIDGADRTWAIRTPQVDQNVSIISAYPGVRQALSEKQRAIGHRYGSGQAEKPGIIMVGRDIGTVVLPEAHLKIYMDASAEERARRRLLQQGAGAKGASYEQILADIVQRDRQDSERTHSPLRAAEDAMVIDTTSLTPEQVVEAVVDLILPTRWMRNDD